MLRNFCSMSAESFATVMATFSELKSDNWIRDKIKWTVRELEETAQDTADILQGICAAENPEDVSCVIKEGSANFSTIQIHIGHLQSVVPPGEYPRYRYMWKFTIQRLIYLSAYLRFLETGELLERDEAAKFLGVQGDGGTFIDLELYLLGLLQLADELARLCLVEVINGRYDRPAEILQFLRKVNEGFLLLNFKNDILRKSYDALKYRVKEVENINVDIVIHGLRENSSACKISFEGD